jgi:hypothetical protein
MNDAQGAETAAEQSRPTRFFGLPAAGASVAAWVRAAFGRSRTGRETDVDVEERIRNIEAELEQARRLDGSAPHRRRLP